MLLLSIATALAQDAPAEEGALEDDTSIGPVLEDLTELVAHLQSQGVQITDVSLGRVKDDGIGASVTLNNLGGVNIVTVGLGDARRISDLDLAVSDGKGGNWSDQMDDNNPVVQFESPSEGGEVTAKLVVAKPVGEAPDGFYILVNGFQVDPEQIIDAAGMVEMLQLSSGLAEGMSLRFVSGNMVVMPAGQNSAIELTIPTGTASNCLVMAFGDPARTKKLGISVADNAGNTLASEKGKGITSALITTTSASSRYRVILTPKLESGYGDAHAMALAACL
jgi:hypothetical protein